MIQMLLTQTVFERLQPRFGALTKQLECITMDGTGRLKLGGKDIAEDDAAPLCAFISNDLFTDSLVSRFADLLAKSNALEWAQSAGAGTDHSLFARLAKKGVRLTTSHGQASAMADYVLWGVLHHFQNGRARLAEQAAHRWTRPQSRELDRTRWLIVGFGAVGEAVARRAKGFGAHVTGIRRRARPCSVADLVTTPDDIPGHLGDTDVVVLCAPLTPETADLVDADFLSAMKPGSMLVNVGRGGLIDEDALLAALDAGKPEHALLDVFRIEPLPPGSRFWNHPRVTLTGHGSGSSSGLSARVDELFLDNLARYLAGEPLLNEVAADDVLTAAGKR